MSSPPSPSGRPSAHGTNRTVQLSSSIDGLAPPIDSQFGDFRPARRDGRGFVGLHFHGRNPRHAVGTQRRFPVCAAGGLPRTIGVVSAFAELLVDLEERSARVLRMHLHVAEFVRLELIDDAHPELLHAFTARRVIVALGDHHVTAGAAAAFEIAPPSGAVAGRCDDFDELIAERQAAR